MNLLVAGGAGFIGSAFVRLGGVHNVPTPIYGVWSLNGTTKSAGQTLAAHGIDLEDAITIWEGPALEVLSPQLHHGEERFLAVGQCEGRTITVVFTWRGKVRRVISARVARRNERENYEKVTGRQAEG